MQITSRAEAREAGERRYFTGLPCRYWHIAQRLTASGNCVKCQALRAATPEHKAKVAALMKTKSAKEKARQRSAAYHKANREQCLARMRQRNAARYASDPEAAKERVRAFVLSSKEWRRAYARQWQKESRRKDPIRHAARRMLHRALALSGSKKAGRTEAVLGYSADDLHAHLEARFLPGMTWANYGKWHIDHIRPLSSFDFSLRSSVAEANALTNLQPLWAADNMRKGARCNGCGA